MPNGTDSALAWYAKVVVAATFCLVFLGGLVTSHQAGMAVPDWPLSYGSLNPEGWWNQFPVRLEHGHRMFAMGVGVLVGILCAWVWQSWRSLVFAVITSAVVPPIAAKLGAPSAVIMHLAIWPAAAVFVASLLLHGRSHRPATSRTARLLALASFACVCIQATLGGLRVTRETAGALDVALLFRITHGIFAQTFLCVNVALATVLSYRWSTPTIVPQRRLVARLRTLAWLAFAAVFLQLIVGAAMRHMGAGLAIPTFPQASPTGSWLPASHNAYVDINFTHTRVGAVLVTILIIVAGTYALRNLRAFSSLARPARGLIFLVLLQFTLGIFVIWHTKPGSLTTLHVLNGAALLAMALLLALRASKAATATQDLKPATSL